MVYTAVLVIHVRLLILFEQSWHASASSQTHVGFTFNCCGQTSGVYPSCAPPLLCQLNNGSFDTRLLNVWDCFLSNLSPFTGTAAGHINIVCRSVQQFVSALSIHAWGELTAKSNTLLCVTHLARRIWEVEQGLPPPCYRLYLYYSLCLPVELFRRQLRIRFTLSYDWWLTPTSCVFIAVYHSVEKNCVGPQRAERADRDVMGWIPWNPFSELHR